MVQARHRSYNHCTIVTNVESLAVARCYFCCIFVAVREAWHGVLQAVWLYLSNTENSTLRIRAVLIILVALMMWSVEQQKGIKIHNCFSRSFAQRLGVLCNLMQAEIIIIGGHFLCLIVFSYRHVMEKTDAFMAANYQCKMVGVVVQKFLDTLRIQTIALNYYKKKKTEIATILIFGARDVIPRSSVLGKFVSMCYTPSPSRTNIIFTWVGRIVSSFLATQKR